MPSMFGHSTPRFHVLLTHRTDSNPNLHGTIHEDLLHLHTLMLLEPKVSFLLLPSRVYHMAIRKLAFLTIDPFWPFLQPLLKALHWYPGRTTEFLHGQVFSFNEIIYFGAPQPQNRADLRDGMKLGFRA